VGFEAAGDVVVHAGTRGTATSAKLQTRTDRAFMLGGQAIPMPCSSRAQMPDYLGVRWSGATRNVAPASARGEEAWAEGAWARAAERCVNSGIERSIGRKSRRADLRHLRWDA
jgi:hypothetical protein